MEGREWTDFVVGTVVHYVFAVGDHRAAFVVKVHNWSTGLMNVIAIDPAQARVTRHTNVPYSNGGEANTWHFKDEIDDRLL